MPLLSLPLSPFSLPSLPSPFPPSLSPSILTLSLILSTVWWEARDPSGVVFSWVCWWTCVCPPARLGELEGRRRGWWLRHSPVVCPRNPPHRVCYPGRKAGWPGPYNKDQTQASHSLRFSWHIHSRGFSGGPPSSQIKAVEYIIHL